MYVPKQGDIVSLDFDPSAGSEIQKRRPAFVVSQQMFNQKTGFAVVVPITSREMKMGLAITLPGQLSVKGTILVHQIRSFDYAARNIKFIEKAPQEVIDHVIKLSRLIVS